MRFSDSETKALSTAASVLRIQLVTCFYPHTGVLFLFEELHFRLK